MRSCRRGIKDHPWFRLLQNFIQNEDGQAVFEYIFLLSLVLVGATALTRAIIDAIDRGILKFGGKFEQYLKTDQAPPNVWTN